MEKDETTLVLVACTEVAAVLFYYLQDKLLVEWEIVKSRLAYTGQYGKGGFSTSGVYHISSSIIYHETPKRPIDKLILGLQTWCWRQVNSLPDKFPLYDLYASFLRHTKVFQGHRKVSVLPPTVESSRFIALIDCDAAQSVVDLRHLPLLPELLLIPVESVGS